MAEQHLDIRQILHDLNNDLSVIAGHLELALRNREQLPDKTLHRLDAIRRATDRMTGHIRAAQNNGASADE